MKKKDDNSFHIKDVVASVLKEAGLKDLQLEEDALRLWAEIVGSEIAGISQPIEIKKGILVVRVKSPAWRNELSYHKSAILKNLEDKLGHKLVLGLHFII